MRNYREEAIENNRTEATKFSYAVMMFAIDGFESAINRKTWKKADEKALEQLEAMVKELKERKG